MRIKFLGTGTSHGVPVLGCKCKTCTSTDPKNKRYRTSVFVEEKNTPLVIDMPAEFRLRAIEYGIARLDAVLFTHAHADHIAGLDDIRRYNEIQMSFIPVYGSAETLGEIKKRFFYIFEKTQEGGGKPKLKLEEIRPYEDFSVKDLDIMPVLARHGELDVIGYRINDFAYITDASFIPERTFDFLKGLKMLVLNALRFEPHPTHFNLEQAVDMAGKIKADMTYFTHITHIMEHNEVEKQLPDSMHLAYDGLELQI
jgi:phosphoribosyl 1,2-cyclic phosphate phosphodiesterase